MIRAHVIAAVLVAVVLSAAPGAAQPAAPITGIWISPPSATDVIPSVMRMIARADLNTVVVPVFYDGRTIYPSRIFPQHSAFAGTDPATVVVNETHSRGLRAFAALDLLYWQSSDDPSPAVTNHPQWLERTAEGRVIGDVPGQPGAFVSPTEPRVTSLLANLASELAARYHFDGIVINYGRWSRLDFLGYADSDRKLYLERQRADPLDIDLLGYATPEHMIQALVHWQEEQIAAVVEATAEAFKRGEPQGVVLAVVEPGYYANRTTNPVRQDWRSWMGKGWLTAVMPDGIAYSDPAAARSRLQAATGAVQAPVVALIRRSNALPSLPQTNVVRALALQGFVLWGRDSLDQRRAVLRDLGAY
jgi:uncharacterized lipoprotein YddW (UPF0748 family)